MQSENLPYSDFKTLLKAGKVIDILLWECTITGRLSTDGLEGLLPPAKIEELRTSGRGEPRFVTVQLNDPTLMTRTELLDRLDVLLGGRTAEEIIFGDVSTGARDDLQRATDLVRHMITRYGMSEALGLATKDTAAVGLSRPLGLAFFDRRFRLGVGGVDTDHGVVLSDGFPPRVIMRRSCAILLSHPPMQTEEPTGLSSGAVCACARAVCLED